MAEISVIATINATRDHRLAMHGILALKRCGLVRNDSMSHIKVGEQEPFS
jgi:hypothetical protein